MATSIENTSHCACVLTLLWDHQDCQEEQVVQQDRQEQLEVQQDRQEELEVQQAAEALALAAAVQTQEGCNRSEIWYRSLKGQLEPVDIEKHTRRTLWMSEDSCSAPPDYGSMQAGHVGLDAVLTANRWADAGRNEQYRKIHNSIQHNKSKHHIADCQIEKIVHRKLFSFKNLIRIQGLSLSVFGIDYDSTKSNSENVGMRQGTR